jgi:hypothetical protein
MPLPIYTQARRNAMQAIMWGVLAASVAVAGIVDHHIGVIPPIVLGAEQRIGPLHVQFPSNWVVGMRQRAGPLAVIIMREPTSQPGEPGRLLLAYRQYLRPMMTPGEYLEKSGLLDDVFSGGEAHEEPAVLGGLPAVRVIGQAVVNTDIGRVVRFEMLITTVFPNRQAVTVRLSKPGEFTLADQALLDAVAASVKVDGAIVKP